MIKININLSKLNKSKLVTGKDNSKYMNAILIDTPNGKYGDYMIVEDLSKEERERGVKGTILGNGKILGGNRSQSSSDSAPQRPTGTISTDDLPI